MDSHLDVNARDEFRHPGNTKLCRQVSASVLERNIRENVVLIMSSIGASKLKLHVSTTFPETRTATTLRQLSSHLSQISPLLTLYTCISLSSVSGESSLISSLPRRENVSNFHLYLCDETKKKERKKKENDILSQVPVKNREEETNQKPLIRFINRNIECTR